MSRIIESDISIIDAIRDPELFGRWFEPPTWSAWLTFLRTLFALPFDENDVITYTHHTGRRMTPEAAFREAWLVVGRRGGKSIVAALVAVYLATFKNYSEVLQPGEVGTIGVISADRKQSRTVFRYVKAFLEIPILSGFVMNETQDSIELSVHGVNIVIEIRTASWRTSRGYTFLAVVLDEIAFFRSEESAIPDKEIVAAVRPGLATTRGLLLCISSPYARRGALWEAYSKHWGKDSRILIWHGTTQEMNRSIDPVVISQALEEDEAAARAEYLAEFRTDTETFVRREVVEAAVVPGRRELARGRFRYMAFTDPSGGSADSFTMAVAHRHRMEGGTADRFVLDCVREVRPPFSPDRVVAEFAAVLKGYGLSKVTGDRYAGEWPRERFRAHGIDYQISERSKSEIYLETLPLLNSSRVELLDDSRLINQLLSLERRTSSAGRDAVDHAPGSHDDLVNAAAGALLLAASKARVENGGIY